MQRITTHINWPLHGVAATRRLEALAAAQWPVHTLMQRAGLAVARLAQALAPHARHIWLACGPGNNGGDGFEAARHLHLRGLDLTVTWVPGVSEPADAKASRERALAAGVQISSEAPADFDLAIDALLGIGGQLDDKRPTTQTLRAWLHRMHSSERPLLAVDVPTGLNGDTGTGLPLPRRTLMSHTLSLLTLKPGLFTGQGRDQAGQVWFDDLGIEPQSGAEDARLIGAQGLPVQDKAGGPHDSHKGSYGDVWVIGGMAAPGTTHMTGAALLAARAALHSGAGRVYVCLLGSQAPQSDPVQPELMFRPATAQPDPAWTLVCGCGGGTAVAEVLPQVLGHAGPLLLDADALNAIAAEPALRRQLKRRKARPTLITPHPMEAARLLAASVAEVQADRLGAARTLSDELGCTVVLKGSGTIIATAQEPLAVNPTGNALLATAGTGDVLAGMIGAALARGLSPHQAACLGVFEHGARADRWAQKRPGQTLLASDLLALSPTP